MLYRGERGEKKGVFRGEALCYSMDMKWSTKLLVRKVLLAACLAAATLALSTVFQRLGQPSAEALLEQLHGEMLYTQTLEVNGRQLLAKVWRLPETSSAAPLKKAAARALSVGKLVFVFEGDGLGKARGDCSYPTDFPMYAMLACDYVVDSGLMRCVTGRTRESREAALAAVRQAAEAAGWQAMGAQVWQRGGHTLFVQVSEGSEETQVAMMMMKQQ